MIETNNFYSPAEYRILLEQWKCDTVDPWTMQGLGVPGCSWLKVTPKVCLKMEKKKNSPLCNIDDLIQMIKKPLTCKQTAMAWIPKNSYF